MIFCPNCGKQTSTEFGTCQNCGTDISSRIRMINESEDFETVGIKHKKRGLVFPKKVFTALAIILVLAAVVIAGVMFLPNVLNFGSSGNNIAYIKNKELNIKSSEKEGAFVVTTSFITDADVSNETFCSLGKEIGVFCYLAKDGKTLFYADKLSSETYGFTLYYRDITKKEKDASKVDSSVAKYSVNENASKVTYSKSNDGALYQYIVKKDEKNKIANSVSNFVVSDDGNTIFYIKKDTNGLYKKKGNSDEEKIDSDVYGIEYASDTLDRVFYSKEEGLYKIESNNEKEKVCSDFWELIRVYDSGQYYYATKNTDGTALIDYVNDDLIESDSAFVLPNRPTYPSVFDYSTDSAYNAAYDKYVIESTKYEQALDQSYDIEFRNSLRASLREENLGGMSYTLWFFDGEEARKVSDTFTGSYESYACAADTPVIAYQSYNQTSVDKVNISQLDSTESLEDLISTALYSSIEQYIAIKDASNLVAQDEASHISMKDDGTEMYFFDNIEEGPNYECFGDLYKVAIANNKVGEPEKIDSDTDLYLWSTSADSNLVYTKNPYKNTGELVVNNNKVDDDVYYDNYVNDEKNGQVVYFTDYDDNKGLGTLTVCKNGKAKKIADDVQSFCVLDNGNILYLYDFSKSSYTGELYLYKNGKSVKLDEEVTVIVPFGNLKYCPIWE